MLRQRTTERSFATGHTGKAGRPQQGVTDHGILKKYDWWTELTVGGEGPARATNWLIHNAENDGRCTSTKCKNTIKLQRDLQGRG